MGGVPDYTFVRKKIRQIRKNYRMGAISYEEKVAQTIDQLYLAGRPHKLSSRRLRKLGLTEQPKYEPPKKCS